jgi:pantoate--beta-alanine ligase
MWEVVAGERLARLDYADVVDAATLDPVDGPLADDARLLIAAWVGATRLIDNRAAGGEA